MSWFRRSSRRRFIAVSGSVVVVCCSVVCFCVFYVVNSNCGSGRERRGIAVVAGRLQPKVRARLMQRRGLMVAVAAAVGLRYGVCAVAFSTRFFLSERGRSIGMLAFLFLPCVVGCTCCMINVFRRKGGVAVDDGNCHGGAVLGWNLYGDSRRLK